MTQQGRIEKTQHVSGKVCQEEPEHATFVCEPTTVLEENLQARTVEPKVGAARETRGSPKALKMATDVVRAEKVVTAFLFSSLEHLKT